MQGNRGGCVVLERRQREFNLEREVLEKPHILFNPKF
jgi:hypothetical protein